MSANLRPGVANLVELLVHKRRSPSGRELATAITEITDDYPEDTQLSGLLVAMGMTITRLRRENS